MSLDVEAIDFVIPDRSPKSFGITKADSMLHFNISLIVK